MTLRSYCPRLVPLFSFFLALQLCSAQAPIRLFVQQFATKDGSLQLYVDLVADLRKQPSVSLVSKAADAQASVIAKGDIFVKGYLGRNPRIRYINSDSIPIYGGYLSAELVNSSQDTVWSYLVTPKGLNSDNINKDLARQIVKHLLPELAKLSAAVQKP